MKKKVSKIFQVELDEEGERIEIHLNQEGITYFIDVLETLKQKTAPDDFELMTPDWGGEALTSSEDSGNCQIMHLLKIMKW